MNSLHICNDFLGSKVHKNLYNELHKMGIEQHVYITLKPHLQDTYKKLHKNWAYSVICSPPTTKKHSYLYESKMNYLYKDIITKFNFKKIDIITATTLFSDGGIALKLHKTYNIPYIVAVRSTDMGVYLKYRPDLAILAYKILKNAKQVVFISDSLKKKFQKHFLIKPFFSKFEKKISIVYNGIDDFWLQQKAKQKMLSNPIKILFVGRLILRKNILSLCKAVLELNKNGINSALTIIGSGDYEKEISHLSLLYPDIIKYVGKIKNKQILKTYYDDHHIFAMPSLGETFGLVYIEALTQGLPVLYCTNEAIDGVFDIKVGVSCEQSIESIKNGILKIIKNYNDYVISEIDFKEFNWNNISKTYLKLYEPN